MNSEYVIIILAMNWIAHIKNNWRKYKNPLYNILFLIFKFIGLQLCEYLLISMNDDNGFEGNGSMFKVHNKDISIIYLTTKLLSLASVKLWKLGFTNRKTALAIKFQLLYFGANAYSITKLFQKYNALLSFQKTSSLQIENI